ncbi:MAG: TlpA family protein disulfide reductase [Cytophagales bacterium]|nr:TlpA family protein disulfide reductase [Cytophagales bacterium]
MEKKILTLLICLTLVSSVYAQIPDKAFDLCNSLSGLWYDGETDKAIESSVELYRLYPPMFIDRIHNALAQHVEADSNQYTLKYLKQLYNRNNNEINGIIAPIYLWSRAVNSKDKPELESITKELNSLLGDSSNYEARTERYCLLIIKELVNKNSIDNKTTEELIRKSIRNIETYSFLVDIPTNQEESEKRAWNRYILACNYDCLYSKINNKEEYLRLASEYSPDLNDRLNKRGYAYDASLLNENTEEFGFKPKYFKYLSNANREKEALDLMSEVAFAKPSRKIIKFLQEYFVKSKVGGEFETYWENYIHKRGKAVPNVTIKFENEDLDFSQKTGSWIYIDVWGTWCRPCRKELPDLQSFYLANQESQNSNLKIYTFSVNSQNLSDFMSDNKYTFPVSEIDKKTNGLFEVSGYPTKILITPGGNYIKIPYGVDWKMYIKNYTLMN